MTRMDPTCSYSTDIDNIEDKARRGWGLDLQVELKHQIQQKSQWLEHDAKRRRLGNVPIYSYRVLYHSAATSGHSIEKRKEKQKNVREQKVLGEEKINIHM